MIRSSRTDDALRRVHRDLVVLDLRDEETIYAGNRFMIYALFPQCRVSMHVLWGVRRQNTVFAIGKSIIDRTSPSMSARFALHMAAADMWRQELARSTMPVPGVSPPS